ncbi:hypothetical protein LIER_11988 [Lithospermum erythrorhizon]|uniref:Aminoacyl-tRNA synthetase class II (D/K/N) domain-containing protein n=1 Tax=Lithospermum erythrorhizon TaxID=34254 RepID=A0AAV3PT10_LITER
MSSLENIIDVEGVVSVPDVAIKGATQQIFPTIFRQFLERQGFVGLHTPKIIPGSSEGGAAVFRLDYKGTPACLGQSPQLYKQMAISGDFDRYLKDTLRLTFEEGVQMLKEAGVEIDPFGDLNTESERRLGDLFWKSMLFFSSSSSSSFYVSFLFFNVPR